MEQVDRDGAQDQLCVKVEVWAPVPNKPTVLVDVKQQAESRTVAKLGSDSRVSCMPASPRKVLLLVVVAVVVSVGGWGWKRRPQLSQFLSNFKPACYF